jgi:hypothetical protein
MCKSFFIAALLLLTLASTSPAQRNPPMPSQVSDNEREQLFARYSENKKQPNPERQRLAYEAARDYVKRYGGDVDSNLPELRRFVTQYERVMRSYVLHEAYVARKYEKVFEIGRENLRKDPEDFYVLATLTQAGYENAQTGDTSLNEETIGYAKSAVALLESGQLNHYDPFETVTDAQGFLNFAVGWFLRDQSPVEAAASLTKSIKSGASVKDDPLVYNLLGIAILKGEYAQLAAEYNGRFGNKLPSPEQQAMWEKLAKLGNRVIDAYARAVALSTKPEHAAAKARLMPRLASLYKSFHNNSDAGLSDLIANVLSQPLP